MHVRISINFKLSEIIPFAIIPKHNYFFLIFRFINLGMSKLSYIFQTWYEFYFYECIHSSFFSITRKVFTCYWYQ